MFIKQANTSEEITKIKLLPTKNTIPSQLQNKQHFKNKLIQFTWRQVTLKRRFLLDQIMSVRSTYGFKSLKSSTCLTLNQTCKILHGTVS
jgi:hypothetical protein